MGSPADNADDGASLPMRALDPLERRATVLIADIEGATDVWERRGAPVQDIVEDHHKVTMAAIERTRGRVVSVLDDCVCAVFDDAVDAVHAAIDIQSELSVRTWPAIGKVLARIGLDTGTCRRDPSGLVGRPVRVAARLQVAAHGGQIVLSGETAAACRERLAPGAELVELGRHQFTGWDDPVNVYTVDVDALRSAFPPLRTLPRGFAELPTELTTLVGRAELIDEALSEVREVRLVTLWGPGGVGKTRVAIRVAASVRRPFADGVCFVDLSVLQPADTVSDTVLAALHARPSAREEPREAVVRALRSLRVLLVLDCCEHVIDDVRSLVTALLSSCPGVHVLATSREALGIEGERHLAVDPFDVPERDALDDILHSAAVELFVERARSIDPRLVLAPDQAQAVAMLCRRLGGMPLAIELAAARLDVDSIEDLIAVGATDGLLDRLAHALPAASRIGSVRGSLQWSFDLLSEVERSMFAALGVFAGSFTRQMALELCGAPDTAEHNAVFSRLVRCSMVSRDSVEPTRFRLLEPAKEFSRSLHNDAAWECLQERHSRLMEARANLIGPMMRTADEAEACRTLRADFADHRRAMHWLLERGDDEQAAGLLVPLLDFYLLQVRSEGHEWARELSSRLDEGHPLASQVAGAAALGAWYAGDIRRATELGERAVVIGERTGQSTTWARMALVDALAYTGRLQDLVEHFRAFVRECRASAEPWWNIGGLAYESIGAFVLGQLERAIERAEAALDLARRLGNPDCVAWALSCLGRALAVEDPDAGCEALEQAMVIQRGIDSRWNGALTLLDWAAVRRRLGDQASTGVGALELLDLLAVSGNRSQLSQVLREAAYALWAGGEAEMAATAMLARAGLPKMPRSLLDPESDDDLVAALREAAGTRWSRLEIRARRLSEDELITLCRSSLESALRDLGPRAPDVVLDRRRDLVVVYTDLVASTSLNVAVGDELFLGLLREHNRIVRRRLKRFGGTEFTYTGDGVGAWFASVDEAVRFALGLQADLDDANRSHLLSPLRVRIGLARGDALAEQGNLFGQTVVRSVRVCATAQAGQVLVTGDIASALDGSVASFASVGLHPLKGFAGEMELYEARSSGAAAGW